MGAITKEQNTRVLIVDDSPGIAQLIETVLEHNGFACRVEDSAQAARGALEEEQFSLMVVDIMMPGETGLELLANVVQPDMCTLVVSGYDDPDLACTALERGASGYLVKPFSEKQLVLTVLACLHRHKLDRAFFTRCRDLEAEATERRGEVARLRRRLATETSPEVTCPVGQPIGGSAGTPVDPPWIGRAFERAIYPPVHV